MSAEYRERARTVRAQHEHPLDVRGLRRPGDEREVVVRERAVRKTRERSVHVADDPARVEQQDQALAQDRERAWSRLTAVDFFFNVMATTERSARTCATATSLWRRPINVSQLTCAFS